MFNKIFDQFANPLDLFGRLFLAFMFVSAGVSKLGEGYAGTQGYMEAMGTPGALLPLVILLEILGGVLLAVGLFTRPSAFLLAGFSIIAGLIFHGNFADQMQMILFSKNIALAGGLLALVAAGPRGWSIDAKRQAVN